MSWAVPAWMWMPVAGAPRLGNGIDDAPPWCGQAMAISLNNIRDELYPGLAMISRRSGFPIAAYRDLDCDVLVIRAGDSGKLTMRITRSEIEDGRHIAKLEAFMELLMCAKSSGVAVEPSATQLAMQQQMREMLDNQYNQYKAEMFGDPGIAPFPPQPPRARQSPPAKSAIAHGGKTLDLEAHPVAAPSNEPPVVDLILDE